MLIETEIVDSPTPKHSLPELMSLYNSTKEAGSLDASSLTSGIQLGSVDEIKEIAQEYVLKIQDLLDSDSEQSTLSKAGSQALAVVDTNSGFLARWFGSKKKAVRSKKLEQTTIDDLVKDLRAIIEAKREDAINVTEKLTTLRSNMLERLRVFEAIEAEVTELAETAAPGTRAKFDAQRLAISVKGSVENLKNDISSVYEPLIMSATVAVENIQQNIPSIEDDLQRMLAAKAGQKSIKQLNDTYLAYAEMGKLSRTAVKAAVNQTMLETVHLVGNTGIDVKELEASAKADIEHHRKITDAMARTSEKVQREYVEIQRIQSTLIENRKSTQATMISQYSESSNV